MKAKIINNNEYWAKVISYLTQQERLKYVLKTKKIIRRNSNSLYSSVSLSDKNLRNEKRIEIENTSNNNDYLDYAKEHKIINHNMKSSPFLKKSKLLDMDHHFFSFFSFL